MLNPNDQNQKPGEAAGRVIAVIFGITFGGVGLLVMGFLWTEDWLPTFFKLFGTLVALPFLGVGVLALLGGLGIMASPIKPSGQTLPEQLREIRPEMSALPTASAGPATNYTCPHCGAPLGASSDASPHGDVKCAHCETWFNIYGK